MKKILYLGILCTLLLSACNDDDKECTFLKMVDSD